MSNTITVSFLTGNSHKFREAREALTAFPAIELLQINEGKIEIKDDEAVDPLADIATRAAVRAASQYGRPVVVEDSGIFFDAYPGFPGLNTKWIMKKIGYEGILRLLSGACRLACFRSAAAYCEPGIKPVVFEGKIMGSISAEVIGRDMDCMDYDRIFIPEGETRVFALIMEQKKKMSHRKIAFEKLGAYLVQNSVKKGAEL